MSHSQPKIAFFLRFLGGGGVETVFLALAQGFVERGISVDLVLSKAAGPQLDRIPAGVRLIDLNAPRLSLSFLPLLNYLRKHRPDTILTEGHYTSEMAVLVNNLAGKPARVFISQQNHFSRQIAQKSALRRWLIPLTMGWAYPRADGVVAVSQGVAADLKTWIKKALALAVIYNPVDIPNIRVRAQLPMDHPWFQEPEIPVVLGVGKLEPQKDFATLIRAVAMARQTQRCRLGILGYGPLEGELRALMDAEGLGEDGALLGYSMNPVAYMARAQVFVLSSAWEGLPLVLLEAIAAGTAVVATDCPSGPGEVLAQGRYGALVPVGDVEAIASAILTVFQEGQPPIPEEWLAQFSVQTALADHSRLFGWERLIDHVVAP